MISVIDVNLCQGEFALDGLNLTLPERAYGILTGPTGCGKTTLLEAICGLRPVQAGQVMLNGRDLTHVSVAERCIGYVPQDAVLFPLMQVERQMEFPLLVRRVGSRQRRERVSELASLLRIEPLLKRDPRGLSGGERQRVALARALAFRPQLLCLDEPLSALDEATRGQLVDLLKQVSKCETVTVLHITHNLAEGEMLGTHHFQFLDGQIVACEPQSPGAAGKLHEARRPPEGHQGR